jgi:hypothetical protein
MCPKSHRRSRPRPARSHSSRPGRLCSSASIRRRLSADCGWVEQALLGHQQRALPVDVNGAALIDQRRPITREALISAPSAPPAIDRHGAVDPPYSAAPGVELPVHAAQLAGALTRSSARHRASRHHRSRVPHAHRVAAAPARWRIAPGRGADGHRLEAADGRGHRANACCAGSGRARQLSGRSGQSIQQARVRLEFRRHPEAGPRPG